MTAKPVQERLRRGRRARARGPGVLRRGLSITPELLVGIRLTVLLALLAGAGRMVTPVLVQQVIDHHLSSGRLGGVVPLAIAGGVVVVLTALCARATGRRLAGAAERGLAALRTRTFRHIHALSIAHHHEESRGSLVSRVVSDVETLSDFFRWGGINFIVDGSLMLVAVATMAVYDWRLTLVALGTMLPIVPLLRYMQRKLVRAWDAVRVRVAEMLGALSESLMGAAVIRAYQSQGAAQQRVATAIDRRAKAEIRAGVIGAVLFPISDVFSALAIAVALVVGMALGPGAGMSTGKLVAFAFLVSIFLEPVANLTELLDYTQQAMAGWRRVLDVLDTPIEVREPNPGLELPGGALQVQLDQVWFAYHAGSRCCGTSAAPSRPAPAWPWSGRPAPARPPWPSCSSAWPTRPRARSAWADWTCGGSPPARCDPRWCWCPRTGSCSTPPWWPTSASADRRPATRRSAPRSKTSASAPGSTASPGGSTPRSGSAASSCPWASGSWSRWHAGTWPIPAA